MKKSKAGPKKNKSRRYHILTKIQYNKQNIVIFYKKWKKYNEIKLTKNKIDLNIRKMPNHPTPPVNNTKIFRKYCSQISE